MALNNRTKLGITVAIAVLLASVWLAVLFLVLAAFLIAWGQVPERTEALVELLPGGLKALARIDLVLWPPGFVVQAEQEELAHEELAKEDEGIDEHHTAKKEASISDDQLPKAWLNVD